MAAATTTSPSGPAATPYVVSAWSEPSWMLQPDRSGSSAMAGSGAGSGSARSVVEVVVSGAAVVSGTGSGSAGSVVEVVVVSGVEVASGADWGAAGSVGVDDAQALASTTAPAMAAATLSPITS